MIIFNECTFQLRQSADTGAPSLLYTSISPLPLLILLYHTRIQFAHRAGQRVHRWDDSARGVTCYSYVVSLRVWYQHHICSQILFIPLHPHCFDLSCERFCPNRG